MNEKNKMAPSENNQKIKKEGKEMNEKNKNEFVITEKLNHIAFLNNNRGSVMISLDRYPVSKEMALFCVNNNYIDRDVTAKIVAENSGKDVRLYCVSIQLAETTAEATA